jgi:multiple sugar transport system substrate-binding protein
MRIDRRGLLLGGAAAVGATLAPGALDWAEAWAQQQPFTPEQGAKLRFLRWSKFLDAEDKATADNIAAFAKATGVEVRIDNIWQDDVETKASVAANIGSGPDIIWALHTTPHKFPDKLLDVTDVAEYIGGKYGGWYPIIEEYGKSEGRWIGIPNIVIGVMPNYRISWVKQAGFDKFPTDTDGFLKLCQELKKADHPAGFAFGKAPNDGNTFVHWLLWSHGGKLVDEQNQVVIDSPETGRALDYARALYQSFIQGTTSWNDASNNKAFLAGQISLTNNSVSIYGKALADKMEMAADIDHANWPVGPVGKPSEMHLVYPMITYKYTKYPNAAKALLAFLMEKQQYDNLLESSIGYVTQTLKGFEENKVWSRDPKTRPFRDVTARARPVAYAGKLGYASASVLSDYVVLDMFAEAVTGSKTAKEAMAEATKRAERYYKV